jgi:hypothetical protein
VPGSVVERDSPVPPPPPPERRIRQMATPTQAAATTAIAIRKTGTPPSSELVAPTVGALVLPGETRPSRGFSPEPVPFEELLSPLLA